MALSWKHNDLYYDITKLRALGVFLSKDWPDIKILSSVNTHEGAVFKAYASKDDMKNDDCLVDGPIEFFAPLKLNLIRKLTIDVNSYTHIELVVFADRWLKEQGYRVRLMEPGISRERADAVGFKSDTSTLIECKASRSDFLNDKKKSSRSKDEKGIGYMRYYMVNEGICSVEELPEGWGLIEVSMFKGNNLIREAQNNPDLVSFEAERDCLYNWALRKLE